MSIDKNENTWAAHPHTPAEKQLTYGIQIDVTQIPDYARDRLTASTLELYKSIIEDPATREMLKRRTEERKAAAASRR